eukprot:1134403-Prorocentrum_minimum.AAC.1
MHTLSLAASSISASIARCPPPTAIFMNKPSCPPGGHFQALLLHPLAGAEHRRLQVIHQLLRHPPGLFLALAPATVVIVVIVVIMSVLAPASIVIVVIIGVLALAASASAARCPGRRPGVQQALGQGLAP